MSSLPPMALVGLQGVIGLCLHCVVVLPAAQFLLPGDDVGGCLENTLDSLVMLRTTPHLLAFVAALTASMARDWFPYAPVRASFLKDVSLRPPRARAPFDARPARRRFQFNADR